MTVLYIGGAGRSGSTLLDLILGNTPGYAAFGEIRFLWRHLTRGDVRCGCGMVLANCGFWRGVLDRWRNGASVSVRAMADWTDRWDRTRHRNRFRRARAGDQPFIREWGRLYRILQSTANGDIPVDASKIPTHLAILQRAGIDDIRVVHLVRDPRAVAYSWGWRVKRDPAIMRAGATMPRRGPLAALAVWTIENEAIRRTRAGLPYVRMRYEDFVAAPENLLTRVLRELELPTAPAIMPVRRQSLRPTHSVGGNPIRFSAEHLVMEPDHRWRTALPRVWRGVLTVLGWIPLRRYGYR